MTKRKKLNLKVIFDTNVIYTGSASDLLRNEIVELINAHKLLTDIEIEWYIPDSVIKERLFQMNKKGNELLPSIQKLEKLLGHNLNITKEIIESRISDTVNKQISALGINTIKIDTTKVDWESIINNSLNRLPPFEDNEKEKGFRDAIILESLKHIISSSPVTKSVCRIVFITNDNALNKAANQVDKLANNIYIYSNVEELVSLVNILDSEITEERISKIILDAEKLFFETANDGSLFYTQNIKQRIFESFPNELNIKDIEANSRENGIWYISKPGFEKKNKQQIIWKNTITVSFSSYKTIISTNPLRSYYDIKESLQLGVNYALNQTNALQPLGISSTNRESNVTKEKISDGKTKFEVMWSVTLTTDNKMKNPKIDGIKYLETVFE